MITIRDKNRRLVLNIVSALCQSSMLMINLAVVYYMRYTFSLPSYAIGLAASTYTVFYFVSCLLLRPVISAMKESVSIMIATVGMSSTSLLIIAIPHVIPAYVFLALYGISMSFLWGPIEAWITSSLNGKALSSAIGNFCFSWGVGAAVSPAITTFLLSYGIYTPFAASIGFLAVSFIAVLILKNARILPDEKTESSEETRNERASFEVRVFSKASTISSYIIYAILVNIFPMQAAESLAKDSEWTGAVLAFRGIVSCVVFIYASRAVRWQFKASFLKAVVILFALVCLLPVLTESSFSYIAFSFVYGILFVFAYEASMLHGAAGLSGKNREKAMLIHEAVINISMVSSVLVSGTLYDIAGFSFVMLLSFAAILIVFISSIIAVFIRRSYN